MSDLDVASVCDRFGLGLAVTPGLRVAGYYHNQVWRLDTITGAYAVKRLTWAPSAEAIEIERRALAAGVPLPPPVPETTTGRHTVELGGAVVRVHRWLDGRAPGIDDLTPALCRRMGALLATVHHAGSSGPPGPGAGSDGPPAPGGAGSDGPPAPGAGSGALVDPDAGSAGTPDTGAGVGGLLDGGSGEHGRPLGGGGEELARLRADTERPEGLGTMVGSHGDLHPKNALLRADGSLALIDWDTAGAYVAEQEAAGVALDWSARLGGDVDLDRFDAVVEGYRAGGGVIPSEPWVFGGWVRGYLDFMRRAGTDEREQTHARLSLLAAILPDLVKRLT
ncbi:phosphotransferase enzyme family protein [Nonomuraea dietziae]|uniref:phosphotransferase enzyme family protein n=1 Tax=Nonomuraea dietziae TaxID=65515 RepID=UPI0033C0CF76